MPEDMDIITGTIDVQIMIFVTVGSLTVLTPEDLISNMNGEESIESGACDDGGERDGCLTPKNTGELTLTMIL